ncbi:ParB/RepB/Spo0J family partition protein [Hellea balneolensis]|uniref:ParB/RepB/Spo0J family partition protein n=1 Tax=Hellea balneolensis TaxID=287478 RepID=UPI0004228183|nr:ParB/RepB/Spo0J family partition protein [Hellea balneolensis]
MKLKEIPLGKLAISKLNMRAKDKNPDISDILPSIRENGVHQSLLVRPEGDGYGVVAGRRRYYALLEVATETGKKLKAPCGILDSGDDAIAIEASLIENLARLPATELEQFAAFKALKVTGRTVADIANHFGVTELKVKRILALANLKPAILKMYENKDIDIPSIRLLTMASKSKQGAWLKLAKDTEQDTPTGHWLKSWLLGEEQIHTKHALFDVKDYKGAILTDLFGETAYFADPDKFWELQNTKIAEAVAEYESDGWTVELMGRGRRFNSWGYTKRANEAGGKVFIAIGNDGDVEFNEGYLSHEDDKKIQAILTGEDEAESKKAPKAKPEMSGPLTEYVTLHRHSAIRAELLKHPKVAMRLTVAHMLVGSYRWSVEAQGTKSRKESTANSVAGSHGATIFEAERKAIYEIVGLEQFISPYSPRKRLADGELTPVFARLLELDDASVMRVMSFAMAESLQADEAVVEALTYVMPVDMAALWEPDEAFFDILRDKKVINAMVKDIAGKGTADSAITDTGKAQKQIILNRIAGHGVDKPNPDWRPRWMQIPATHYLDKTTCPPAGADAAVSKVMMKVIEADTKIAA